MNNSPQNDIIQLQSSSIPEGWHLVRFGDVAKKVSAIIDRNNCELDRFVAGEHMQTDDFRIKEWGLVDNGYLGPAFNHKFTKGQLLYGSRRTYLRKVSIPHFDGICANTTFVIEPTGNDLIPELLPFIMQSAGFTEHSIRMSKGSTNPYINWKDIACYEFAVPDKENQRRIATLLWAAEDCIVKGERFVEAAERTKQVLMRELFCKGIGDRELADSPLGKIPKSWAVVPLSKISKMMTNGFVGVATQYYSKPEEGIVYLRSTNIRQNRIDVNNCVYVLPKFNQIHAKSILKEGDMLTVQSGHIGTSAIVTKSNEGCNCHALIITRFIEDIVIPSFVCLYLNSEFGIKRISSFYIGSTVPHINTSDLKEFEVPLPPLPEQRQIAKILSRCDETIAAARANVEATRALKMRLINEMLTPEIS